MTEEFLKVEADDGGVWLSVLSEEVALPAVRTFLRARGVRKYDEKVVETLIQRKAPSPQKIADRNAAEEQDANIVVQLSKDNMAASVVVEAPFFTHPVPGEKEIEDALALKNVVFGVDKEALQKLLHLRLFDETVVVAKGRPPENGENARIELLLDPDRAPTVNQDAQKIDYRERSVFTNVRRGDAIAVKHPATEGREGMSVVGTPVKAVPGKDAPFPTASGFEVAENGLSLVAAIDGILLRKDGKLSILPELEVKGDVDFGVGNINFTGSVKIRGAVREGFHVVAAGDIEIKELVEGAHIESSGNILIAGGVRGMGKARIAAEGDVTAGFVDQAQIRSGRDVKVKGSLFHSDVAAHNSVTVMGGQKSQIAGGKIQAGLEVVCQTLGSEMGTKTEVAVGTLPGLAERRKELQTLVAQNTVNLEKMEANLVFLKKREQEGTLDEEKRNLMLTATKTKFKLQSGLKSMADELKDIEERLDLYKAKSVVRVKDVCYPGVTIMIRNAVYVVREPFKFASFIYEDGEIRLRSFDS